MPDCPFNFSPGWICLYGTTVLPATNYSCAYPSFFSGRFGVDDPPEKAIAYASVKNAFFSLSENCGLKKSCIGVFVEALTIMRPARGTDDRWRTERAKSEV